MRVVCGIFFMMYTSTRLNRCSGSLLDLHCVVWDELIGMVCFFMRTGVLWFTLTRFSRSKLWLVLCKHSIFCRYSVKRVVHDACSGIRLVVVFFFVFVSIARTTVLMSLLMVRCRDSTRSLVYLIFI
jgi:hypothetical protein